MQMKRWIAGLTLAAALGLGMPAVMARAVPVPETVYQWVQSSPRMNYYFNKQQICFAVDDDGFIDLNTLIVPTVRTYDSIKIQDVLDKRRWRMESTDGFDDLAGEADYLQFNLALQTVDVTQVDLLDSGLATLSSSSPAQVIQVAKLPPKSLDSVFYHAVLDYAKQHQDEIIAHTKGQLKVADQKRLAAEKKAAEKAARDQAKNDKKHHK